jgi:hypothetical protein
MDEHEQGRTNFPDVEDRPQILCATVVILGKFHNEVPQILGASVPVDAPDLRTPERNDGYFAVHIMRVFVISIVSECIGAVKLF